MITFVVGDLTEQRRRRDRQCRERGARRGRRCLRGDPACGRGRDLRGVCAASGVVRPATRRPRGPGACPARYVVHAVGPIWRGGEHGEAELLASAHRRALEVAEGIDCRTVAFPALSTGIYRYCAELAAPVAVAAVRELEGRFDEIRFVFLEESLRGVFASVE